MLSKYEIEYVLFHILILQFSVQGGDVLEKHLEISVNVFFHPRQNSSHVLLVKAIRTLLILVIEKLLGQLSLEKSAKR